MDVLAGSPYARKVQDMLDHLKYYDAQLGTHIGTMYGDVERMERILGDAWAIAVNIQLLSEGIRDNSESETTFLIAQIVSLRTGTERLRDGLERARAISQEMANKRASRSDRR
jgi:uncharacterized membrane protein